jgi:hypothetical protein
MRSILICFSQYYYMIFRDTSMKDETSNPLFFFFKWKILRTISFMTDIEVLTYN